MGLTGELDSGDGGAPHVSPVLGVGTLLAFLMLEATQGHGLETVMW